MRFLWYDFLFALRSLRRRPAFAATVVATLGLGMGANSAVFGVIDSVILHPLPIEHAGDLVAVHHATSSTPYGQNSFGSYRHFANERAAFAGVAGYVRRGLDYSNGQATESLNASFVTENYFSVLGVRAAIGRVIASNDPTAIVADPVVVLSDAFWRSRFGGDREIVGKQIQMAAQQLTVIGVAPEGFNGTDLSTPTAAWIPIGMLRSLANNPLFGRSDILGPDSRIKLLGIIGRLGRGVSAAKAAAVLNTIDRQLDGDESPAARSQAGAQTASHISITPLTESAAGLSSRAELLRFVGLLFAVVSLTLLLACVNVANLVLIRTRERSMELGIRGALGASATRLARHLLIESATLSCAGALVGLVIALVATQLLSHFALPGGIILGQLRIGLDGRTLTFNALVAFGAAASVGLLPAIQAARGNVSDILVDRTSQPVAAGGRRAFLAIQIAISLMLLVGAGLFLRSLQGALGTDLGFDPRSLVAVSIRPDPSGRSDKLRQQATAIIGRLASTPNVQVAAAGSHVPLALSRQLPFTTGPATEAAPAHRTTLMLAMASVSPEYFRALNVPVVQGRGFDGRDVPDGAIVVVLNESAARSLWPGESALGKQINLFDARTYTVVGVVPDIKYTSLQDQGVPFAYAPLSQEDVRGPLTFVVKTTRPQAVRSMLKRAVSETAPAIPVGEAELVSERINRVLMPQRFGATLLSLFAVVALCVSAVGIYGTVAYSVTRRTTEIGVRIALGAGRRDVMLLVLSESIAVVGAGICIGVLGAASSTQLLGHFLYKVSGLDWVSFAFAVVVVMVTCCLAVLGPAGRAVRIDPVRAIRAQ